MNWDNYWSTRNPEIPDVDMVRYFINKPRGRVLEIGAGVGQNCLWLHQHGFEVVGIDSSEEAFKKAVYPIRNCSIGEFSPFDPFDYVIDLECLTYCCAEDISKVKRAFMRPDGALFSKWFSNVEGLDVGPWGPVDLGLQLFPQHDVICKLSRKGPGFQVKELVWEGFR